MANTNNSTILFGDLLQLGGGVFGAGTSQVMTTVFSGAPAAGSVTFSFWGIPFTVSTASGLRIATAFQTALNAIFGTAYVAPFTVALATNTYTITANPAGPFAFMPLPTLVTVANTSLTTITHAITTPGVTQETYATCNGVEIMPWASPTKDIETYLTLDPGTNGYKRKIAKFADAGSVSFTVVMTNDAQQNAVTGFRWMFTQNQTFDWRIVEPTKTVGTGIVIPGSTYYYSAYVAMFKRNGNTPDSRQRWDGTLAIDGSVNELPPLA